MKHWSFTATGTTSDMSGSVEMARRTVFRSQTPFEREIQGQSGHWFVRRIMPYHASDQKTEGVVITYEDVTERRGTAEALSAAKRQAELASVAKSRFLAAASHDLRQPLQTLALLQGLLAKKVVGEKAQKLVGGIDRSFGCHDGNAEYAAGHQPD